MIPGELALELRARSPWEALDLGVAMYRRWFPALMGAWLAVYLPTALVCALVFQSRPWVALLILWWLKPVFERFVLHVASRAAFGRLPGVRATLAAWREILSPLPWIWLTIGRPFFLQRGYSMPVSQLERLTGAARRGRERVLGRRAMSAGTWLAVIGAHFEAALGLSIAALVEIMTPGLSTGFRDLFARLGDSQGSDAPLLTLSDLAIQAAATTLVAPAFVCAGFSLYLNRRSQIEAWDLEVQLRRIQDRLGRLARTGALLLGAGAVLIALAVIPAGTALAAAPAGPVLAEAPARPVRAAADGAASADPAVAADAPLAAGPAGDAAAAARLRAVLADPDFGTTRTEKHWRRRNPREDSPDELPGLERWRSLIGWMAQSVRAVFWIAAVLLAGFLVWLLATRRRVAAVAPVREAPDVILGVSIRPDSLPADVAGTAERLFRQGDARAALALLYRAALSALVHRLDLQLAAGATERDVLTRSQRVLAAADCHYLEQLIGLWSAAAYAGRLPDPGAAESLCARWPAAFGTSGGEAR